MNERIQQYRDKHPNVEKAIVVMGAVGGFAAISLMNSQRRLNNIQTKFYRIQTTISAIDLKNAKVREKAWMTWEKNK